MKRIALSLLAVLALGAPAKAIVGGPWDNNLFYSPTLNGTFQGTLTGKNISAVMMFSTASSSASNATDTNLRFKNAGRMVSFYRGIVVASGVEAVPNASTHKIAAIIKQWGNSQSLTIEGFMDAKFDNLYPSITYKGKADLVAYQSSPLFEEEFQARVRGIKTSNSSSGFWNWSVMN